MSPTMYYELVFALGQTLYMVFFSTLFAVIIGLPLGTLVYSSAQITPNKMLHKTLSFIINMSRSIPFIILLVALIPVTRILVGSSIGIHAAIVPLTLGAIPLFARLVDNIYRNLSTGLLEAGHAMGASNWQMITHILIPEGKPAIIQAITITAITLINYSAMAGTVGGGGLGDLAIRYGYQRFDVSVMISTVVILIILVQLIQVLGDHLVKRYTH